MLQKVFYSVGPVVVVLLAEHIILKYIYGKKSSIERLFIGVSDSAKSDWLMAIFYYIVFKFQPIRTIASLITLPGLIFLGLKWLQNYFQWSGIFGLHLPESNAASFAIWFVLYDFTRYQSHVLMHKSPWFWRFHKLHHAATEFTILTGIRTSLSERFFNEIVTFVVLVTLLGVPRPEIFIFVVFIRRVIDLIQHSDLPWDYGTCGYLIASPRFHRLHHSNQSQDYDSNYGDIFSFWDYLFSTTSTRYRDSPSIADECNLGLATEMESSKFNQWETALFHETLLQHGWATLQKFPTFLKYR